MFRLYEELTALITGSKIPSARYDNDVPESTNVPCVFDVVNKEGLIGIFSPLTEMPSIFKL
jgi:hypothetical protein